ncbi:hypothetical protein B0O99DRAFT_728549 [Bisporella sp. PMI_857]|nr:hypothetical protein B0O99DRAFT_728549 [Bisporella sp. PMI_857]
MTVVAPVPHEEVVTMLALIGQLNSEGGAIYVNMFPGVLAHTLPGNSTLNSEL